MKEFTAGSDDAGKRVDVFLAGQYPQFSRSALSLLFNQDLVFINKKPVKAGEKIKENDVIGVNDNPLFKQPATIDLPILYEDQNVIVMNKPAGILTHSKGNLNLEATVATFIKSKLTDEQLTGNRAGIVHRLDRFTSGVIIAAKSSEVLKDLQKQFSQRKTKKTYIAIVEGWPEEKRAVINAPIERNPKKPQTFRVGEKGRPAQTNYEVLDEFTKNGKKFSKLKLQPTTGRTHQLRVHLAYINHPIVGDRVYGTQGPNSYLHAQQLEVTLPRGQRKVFKAPLPQIFEEFNKK